MEIRLQRKQPVESETGSHEKSGANRPGLHASFMVFRAPPVWLADRDDDQSEEELYEELAFFRSLIICCRVIRMVTAVSSCSG